MFFKQFYAAIRLRAKRGSCIDINDGNKRIWFFDGKLQNIFCILYITKNWSSFCDFGILDINICRILMILIPFESAFKALSNGTKIIKIRQISIPITK